MKRELALLTLILAMVPMAQLRAQHETGSDVESGSRAYENSCASCHGPDGNLIAGIDFSRGIYRRALSDDEIVQIILNGIPNTPMPPTPGMSEQQSLEVVAYLRALPQASAAGFVQGDAERGRQIVLNQSDCLDCHRIAGQGSRLGPNLSQIGLDRRAIEIEIALLDPEAEVQAANRIYSVLPRRGDRVTGRLLNHDTFSVQMIDEDERLRSFQKSDLREFGFVESLMLSYRETFNAQELADVVSYLVSLRGNAIQ